MRKMEVSSNAESRIWLSWRRGGQIAAERFLDDHAGAVDAAGLGQLLDDRPEHDGRNGQVECRPAALAERFAQDLERRGIVVVAVHVAEHSAKLFKGGRVEATVFFDAVASPREAVRDSNWIWPRR